MTIKVYVRSKTAVKPLKDAIPSTFHPDIEWIYVEKKSQLPQAADLVVDLGKAETSGKAIAFAAQRGCRIVHCIPEACDDFQKRLRNLIDQNPTHLYNGSHTEGTPERFTTRIVDAALYKVVAL